MTSKLFLFFSLLLVSVVSLHAAFWTIGSGAVDTVARARLVVHTNRVDNPHEVALSQLGIATATVSRATWADKLGTSTSWTAVEDGTNWSYIVNSTSLWQVMITAYSEDNMKADVLPPVGTKSSSYNAEIEGFIFPNGIIFYYVPSYPLLSFDATSSQIGLWEAGATTLPVILPAADSSASGTVTIDWVYDPQTNRTAQATATDLAAHNANPASHADIRAAIPTLPGPGCTVLTYAADGTNVTITGATYSYFFAPDKAYTLSVAPDAPRYHYSIEIIGDHACTLPVGYQLRGAWTITGTNEVVVVPSTGTVWNVFGRGL